MSTLGKRLFRDVWNVPNVLTMIRLALIPVFAVLHASGRGRLALLVFCVASLTDWLDGYLARKHHQITDFGKLMDPLADKLMVCTALVMQGLAGVFPWWAILVVMTKEIVMIIGGMYMLSRRIVVYANLLGKAAQVSFIAALVLSFWHEEFASWVCPLDRVILILAVILALTALVEYSLSSLRKLRALKENG